VLGERRECSTDLAAVFVAFGVRWATSLAVSCRAMAVYFRLAVVTGVGVLALPIAALRIAGSVPVIKQFLGRADGER
jgi:hypothetical protein